MYLGGNFAYKKALLLTLECGVISTKSSLEKFADGFNLQAFQTTTTNDASGHDKIDRRRLMQHFFFYELIKFKFFMGHESVELPSAIDFKTSDDFMHEQFEHCYQEFVFFWSQYQVFKPCKALCSVAAVIDGHQKFRRRICKLKNICIKTDEFESIPVGCSHTPAFKSQFCYEHQPAQTQQIPPSAALPRGILLK
ncbi:unnamed protein product [Didymodactylos carnosus]|uniref:Uncharacterized protein n=2 Tax=Didymodactylos carnosus TaxID=1234261 RepID=A0A814VVU7_9BILA|nr:unnamed protein product [Didymodactylos carnosus]CAF3957353.1 unnamed protein product [Didymodactylos carnosus]